MAYNNSVRPLISEKVYNDMKAALADVKGPLAQIIRGNAAASAD